MPKPDLTPLVVEIRKLFALPRAVEDRSLVGHGKKIVVEDRIGLDAGSMSAHDMLVATGRHNDWKKACAEEKSKYKGDIEGYKARCDELYADFIRQIKGACKRFREEREQFYASQDLCPRMAWIQYGDKKKEMVFAILAMVEVSSRKLAYGDPKDYRLYLQAITSRTKEAHDAYDAAINDARVFKAMGIADKSTVHALELIIKGESPEVPALENKSK